MNYPLANDRLDIFPHFSSLCKCDHPEILNPKRQSNIILVILIILWHWKVIEGKLLASLTSFVSFVIRYNFRLCPHQFSIGVIVMTYYMILDELIIDDMIAGQYSDGSSRKKSSPSESES